MTAYLAELSDDFITINADDTSDRRSRAAQISAHKRRQEKALGVTLTLISKSHSETHGFLAQSSFRYRVARPPVEATPAIEQVIANCEHPHIGRDGQCTVCHYSDYAPPAPASPYVADPANPTDAEMSAAIQRGLDSGQIITAEQFLASVADDAPTTGLDVPLADWEAELLGDDRQRWFADSLSSVTFHALTSLTAGGHAACDTAMLPVRLAYTVDELPDSARPCVTCNATLRATDDTPIDWVAAFEIPASADACSCGIPSRANFYASGVILGDDFTEELSDYLCAGHAPGHRASVKETLGHGEALVEYELAELR